MLFIKRFLAHIAIISLVFNQFVFTAFADDLPITVDGATATQVTRTASGVDQINIAAPNSSGLSHNTFTDYNVNSSGQILNNFSGTNPSEIVEGTGGAGVALTSTQIGGLVVINQNLSNSGSARIILNEVTSSNDSQLRGYVEIAGTKAELIIANPNGITCSGCGFINTSQLSMIVGSSHFDSNGNLGFNIPAPSLSPDALRLTPLITISGLGLDVESTSATDIIASSIKLISTIYGSEQTDITLKTGNGKYDHATKSLTPNALRLAPNSPELFAIDATNLGAVQSGRIFIVATQDGFGVNLGKNLLATKSLNIDSAGNLYYENLISPKIHIKSTSNITQSGNIVTSGNLDITTTKTFTNFGILKSDSDINLTTNNLENFFLINAKNLKINAENFLNKSGGIIGSFTLQNEDSSSLAFKSDSVLLTSKNFSNFGMISGDLVGINSDQLNNDGDILAAKELTINARQLSNSKNIYSASDAKLTAFDTLTNSNNSTILAENSLILTAPKIINNAQDAYGIFTKKSDLIIESNNLNNDGGLIQAKGQLKISSSDKISGVTTSNLGGFLLAVGGIDFDLGGSDYEFGGTVSTLGDIKISAKNISNISGDVSAANGIILISANNFTNGNSLLGAEQNNNFKIIAGKNLIITAANQILNYAILSSANDLTLTSNFSSIDNYHTISGGDGITNLSAITSAINNYQNPSKSNSELLKIDSKISSNNDLKINAKNLNNSSRIMAKHDLTFNITNDLNNNSGSVIYANNNLNLNIDNNLNNNRQSSILALKDIVVKSHIAGFDNLYKLNQFNNISATFQSYEGNITINTKDFLNKRSDADTSVIIDPNYVDVPLKAFDNTLYSVWSFCSHCGSGNQMTWITIDLTGIRNPYGWTPPYTSPQLYKIADAGTYGNGIIKTVPVKRIENPLNQKTKITAAGNLTINSDNFTNSDSEITAIAGNVTINTNSFTNIATTKITDTIKHYCSTPGWCQQYLKVDLYNNGNLYDVYYGNRRNGGESFIFDVVTSFIPTFIKAKGNIAINSKSNNPINNGEVKQKDNTLAAGANDIYIYDSAYKSTTIATFKITGSLNNKLITNFLASENLFQKSINPNAPLFETRLEFIDKNKFFSSDYYFKLIGYDPVAENQKNLKLIGDAMVQSSIIELQLNSLLSNKTLLDPNATSLNSQIQSLYDNAFSVKDDLELEIGEDLTATQLNSLNKNILWLVNVNIAGENYLTPKLFLSKENRFNLNESAGEIIAGNNISITSSILGLDKTGSEKNNNYSATLNNSGSILAQNNLFLTNLKSLNNQGRSSLNRNSTLEAGGDLAITTTDSLINLGNVKTTGINSSLTLTSLNGDIVNSSKFTNKDATFSNITASNNLALNALRGTILNKSALSAGNNLTLTAQNIKNISTIETNDANLLTSNPDAYQLRFGDSARSSGNISSRLIETASITAKNIEINSANNFTNLAAKITTTSSSLDATASEDLMSLNSEAAELTRSSDAVASKDDGFIDGGNISITAGGDINIITLQLHNRTEERGGSRKTSWEKITDTTTNLASEISSSGNISLNSNSDVNIIGANLSAADNITITSTQNTNILASQNTSFQSESFSKKGFSVSKSSGSGNSSLTNIHANLTTENGDIIIASQGDTNIIGAKLNGGSDASITSLGETNISSVTDQNSSYSYANKSKTGILQALPVANPILKYIAATDLLGLTRITDNLTGGGYSNLAGNEKTRVNTSGSNQEIQTTNLTTNNNLQIQSNQDLNLTSTNLKSENGDIELASNQNINILAAQAISTSSRDEDGKTDRKKSSTEITKTEGRSTSSTLEANNITLTSANDITLQATKIKAEESVNITAAENLLITTAQDFSTSSETNKSKTTFAKSLGSSGAINATITNTEISSSSSSSSSNPSSLDAKASEDLIMRFSNADAFKNDGVVINAGNLIYAEYDPQKSTTASLNYLAALDPTKAIYNPLTEIHQSYDQTNRSLTNTSQALIAVAAVAIAVGTGGIGTGISGAILTAGATTTGTIATTSATNASMNADGSVINQLKTTTKTAVKDTTSKESLQAIAISAAAAGLAQGAMQASGVTNATNGTNVASAPNTVAERITNNLSIGLQKAAIHSTSNIIATSAIKGQSLNQTIEEQGGGEKILINTALNALAETGAKEIGRAAHSFKTDQSGNILTNASGEQLHQIDKATQLTLHGALGATISTLRGNDNAAGIISGAAAAAVGELAADSAYSNGADANKSIAIGQAAGSLAALTTSTALGASDEQTAKNIQMGNYLAGNSAVNNATLVVTGTDKNQKKSSSKDLDPEFRKAVETTFGEKLIEFEWTGGNTKEARAEAAVKLNEVFTNYEFAPDEKLNLIGFSHGGNVIKELTQIYEGQKKIDNLVFLGTPHRADYRVDLGDLNFYANKVSVADVKDGVQTRGYIDGSVYKGAITLPQDIRLMTQGFINVRSDQDKGAILNHTSLPSAEIWHEKVEPNLINK